LEITYYSKTIVTLNGACGMKSLMTVGERKTVNGV